MNDTEKAILMATEIIGLLVGHLSDIQNIFESAKKDPSEIDLEALQKKIDALGQID